MALKGVGVTDQAAVFDPLRVKTCWTVSCSKERFIPHRKYFHVDLQMKNRNCVILGDSGFDVCVFVTSLKPEK